MIETGTAGPSTAAREADSPSIADYANSLFGDHLPMGDVPVDETEPTDAGAPPADALDATATDSDGSEGREATAAHAEDPSADAAAANARPDAAAPAPDPSPTDNTLDGYAPLSYAVDGERRSVDGIQEHPEYGAIVDPAYLPTLKQRLSERDHLFERSKAQHEQYTQLEQVTRWPVQNAQGQTEWLTGAAAIEASRALLARSIAINEALSPMLDGRLDPQAFLVWDDANQRVTWNTEALTQLRERIAFDADRREWTTRRTFDPYRGAAPTTSTAPAAETPVASHAAPTIAALAESHGMTSLTAEDQQFLAEQFEQYVRPTTAEERRQDPTLGARVVDEKFLRLMQRVAANRTATAKVAQVSAETARTNAARMQAAAAGRRPAAPGTRPTAAPAVPVPDARMKDASDAWDLAERASAAAMRQR